MVAALVAHDLLTPEEAHHLDLFFYDPPSRMEIHAQGLIFYRVPAYPYAEAYLAACENVHLRRLLGDERGLPLREDDDSRNQFQACQRCEVAEEHEWFVEHILLSVTLPAPAVRGISTQNVVIRDKVTVTQPLRRLRVVTNDQGVCADLGLRKRNSYLHIRCTSRFICYFMIVAHVMIARMNERCPAWPGRGIGRDEGDRKGLHMSTFSQRKWALILMGARTPARGPTPSPPHSRPYNDYGNASRTPIAMGKGRPCHHAGYRLY